MEEFIRLWFRRDDGGPISSQDYYRPLLSDCSGHGMKRTRRRYCESALRDVIRGVFRVVVILAATVFGCSLYYRTTNMWALKNLGDSFIVKSIGRRPIVLGAFHRLKEEQNVDGNYAVGVESTSKNDRNL